MVVGMERSVDASYAAIVEQMLDDRARRLRGETATRTCAARV